MERNRQLRIDRARELLLQETNNDHPEISVTSTSLAEKFAFYSLCLEKKWIIVSQEADEFLILRLEKVRSVFEEYFPWVVVEIIQSYLLLDDALVKDFYWPIDLTADPILSFF